MLSLSVILILRASVRVQLSPDLNKAIEGVELRPRSGYFLGWFDAVVGATDRLTHMPLLEAPPAHMQDVHTPASVFLGNMMVSDVTGRLKAADLQVSVQVRDSTTD